MPKRKSRQITKFTAHGPFTLHQKRHGRGYRIVYSAFWKNGGQPKSLGSKKGVYVFGIRAGKGMTPIYVGRATGTTFKTECFNRPNRRKYRNGLQSYKRCTPVVLLIVHPEQRGRLNRRAIDEIETFFVQLCAEKNGKLQNLRKRDVPKWGITGVIRCSRRGPRKPPETALKIMAGLKQ
jgi:hypothetical protein